MNADNKRVLTTRVDVKVRFSEVDILGMVWHGNYVRYLEDAREAFGHEYGIEYMWIKKQGYIAPIYDVQMRYLGQSNIDDVITVEIRYVPDKGAKLVYDFTLCRKSDSVPVMTARTIQLFQTLDGEFVVSKPQFITDWEKRNGI